MCVYIYIYIYIIVQVVRRSSDLETLSLWLLSMWTGRALREDLLLLLLLVLLSLLVSLLLSLL